MGKEGMSGKQRKGNEGVEILGVWEESEVEIIFGVRLTVVWILLPPWFLCKEFTSHSVGRRKGQKYTCQLHWGTKHPCEMPFLKAQAGPAGRRQPLPLVLGELVRCGVWRCTRPRGGFAAVVQGLGISKEELVEVRGWSVREAPF